MTAGDLVKKVVVWRVISIFLTLTIMYAATGDVKSATGITFTLQVALTACHYTFEKCWGRLHEGR